VNTPELKLQIASILKDNVMFQAICGYIGEGESQFLSHEKMRILIESLEQLNTVTGKRADQTYVYV